MTDRELIDTAGQVLMNTYVRPELVLTHGQGCTLYDSTGRAYLDLTSGIAVVALGHSDPEWAAAVAAGATELTHVSNLYHTRPQVELATLLVQHSFADRVFFCNSGAEANEGALKFARKYAKLHGDPHKTQIVAFSGGFHGRTMGALSATYKAAYREPFAPLVGDITFAPFNDLTAAAEVIGPHTAAVIVEPIQGEGGVHSATPAFLAGLRTLCHQHGALLIFDEVQCGLGRTGQLWAHSAYGVTPDIMTLAKPLANGLPIGAVLVTEAVASAIVPGDHGSTFAGGPLVTRAAQVVLRRVADPNFLADVAAKGQYLTERLKRLESDAIVTVRGAGLLIGVELNQPVKDIITAARERGVLLLSAGENVLRLAPPLVITKAELDTAVEVLDACLP